MTSIRKIIKDLQFLKRTRLEKGRYEAGFIDGANASIIYFKRLEKDILRILNGEKGQTRSTQVCLDILGRED